MLVMKLAMILSVTAGCGASGLGSQGREDPPPAASRQGSVVRSHWPRATDCSVQVAAGALDDVVNGRPDAPARVGSEAGPAPSPQALAHYAAGVELMLLGDWGGALEAFRRVRALDPQSARVALKIGQCLDQLGRRDEALAEYRTADQLAPAEFDLLAALGNAYDERDLMPEAVKAFERALAAPDADPHTPEFAIAVWRLASTADRARQPAKALAQYRRFLDLLLNPRPEYQNDRRLYTLVLHPEFVCEQVGKLHLQVGEVDSAVAAFLEGRRHAPDSVTLTYRLAEAYLQGGAHEQALAEAERLIGLAGSDATALDVLVRAAAAAQKPEAALRLLEPRLRADPDNLLLRVYLATVYRQVGRLDQAEQLLHAVLEARRNPLAYGELAAVLRRQQRAGDALDLLAEAIDHEQIASRVMLEINAAAEELAADTPARQTWRPRAEAKPKSPGAQYVLGSVLTAAGDFDAAAQAFQRVLALRPAFIWAYVDLAALNARRKDYAGALAVYRAATDRGLARNPLILRMIAHLHERLNQLPEALQAVEDALQIDADDSRTRYVKAHILDRMGRDAEAEAEYRAILAADPADTDANNALSYFFATRRRNLDEARQLIDKALKREPDNGAFLDTLGWVLYGQGDYAEALKALLRAAEAIQKQQPEGDPVIFDHLGDAHEKLKQYPQARDAWQRALELNASDPSPEIVPETLRKKIEQLPPAESHP